MKALGVRAQLTLLYSLVLALSLTAFGCVAYFAMAYSIRNTVRSELAARTAGVRDIINEDAKEGRAALADEVSEFADGLGPGGRVRLADATGVIFASPGMNQAAGALEQNVGRSVRITIAGQRFAVQRLVLEVNGTTYDLELAIGIDDLEKTLDRGSGLLLLAAPLFLLLAAIGGYAISRRALVPVEQMAEAARRIGAQDLSQRVAVPPARDELARLAETLNEMLARLESAFRKITQFTADASHELRTPVAVIRTSAEIALRKSRTEDEYRETLALILREASGMTAMIENLLSLARADSGAAQLPMKPVEVSCAVKHACESSAFLAAEKGVTLHAPNGVCEMFVNANAESLERLFVILLDNAVRYTPRSGTIAVRLQAQDGLAVVQVADNGIGIAPADLPFIFDRFFRSDQARTREVGGAGLGLAIGRWIAETHGGELRVQSEPGTGSCFEVRLPLVPA